MQYCKRCLYAENHPLGITFDDEGICSGCRIHEEKDRLDWNQRGDKLKTILDSYRVKSGTAYDCIIPVSGARDSYFIVDTIKNVYGMNPLLVSYNKHYNTQVGIRNLAYLKTLLGCDAMALTVSPDRVKRITRATLQELGSMYWHCLAGQTVYPVTMAVRFKIPLIIWGAHQGIDQVGMFSHLDEVEMSRRYRKDHDLIGIEAEDLLSKYPGLLTEEDMRPFMYPHDKELEKVGVRGIYLNNYIRWDTKAQHEKMIRKFGYESYEQERTFDSYNDVDCFHYSSLHDYIKLLKWGYGKVTDHACREIRLRRLTREQGLDAVKRFTSVKLNEANLNQFLKWLEMSPGEFWKTIEKFRNKQMWKKNKSGHWELENSYGQPDPAGEAKAALGVVETCHFLPTQLRDMSIQEREYTLIGRGYVDSWSAPNGNS